MSNPHPEQYETHATRRKREIQSLDRALTFMDNVEHAIDTLTQRIVKIEVLVEEMATKVEKAVNKMNAVSLEVDLKWRTIERMVGMTAGNQPFETGSGMQLQASASATYAWNGLNDTTNQERVPDLDNVSILDEDSYLYTVEGELVHPDEELPLFKDIFNIEISIVPPMSRVGNPNSGIHFHHNEMDTGTNADLSNGEDASGSMTEHVPSRLASLSFALSTTTCPTLDQFLSEMTSQADACEADLQQHEHDQWGQPIQKFEEQFGKMRCRVLLFAEEGIAVVDDGHVEENFGNQTRPMVLDPHGLTASQLYRDWYERNVVSGETAGRIFNVEAIFECGKRTPSLAGDIGQSFQGGTVDDNNQEAGGVKKYDGKQGIPELIGID